MDQTADLWIDCDDANESFPSPPVETRIQVLPLEKLTWENLERLCYRLAWKSGDVSDCRRYGVSGQNQQGIDIYVRRISDRSFSTWQCKRYIEFTPAEIVKAVDEFLKNDWARRSTVFNLAVTVSLSPTALADAVEEQAKRCRESGIEFVPLDADHLSCLLKEHPDLVDDFFGRPWVEAVCGSDSAQRLSGRRLNKQQRVEARRRLCGLYTTHFASIDVGLPAAASALRDAAPHLPLRDRYIAPQVESINPAMERRVASFDYAHSVTLNQQGLSVSEQKPPNKEAGASLGFRVTEHRDKLDLFEWLATIHQGVILGGPGLGKSAALRFLAMDLLSDQPRVESLAKRWGGYLPLLVPFALLTRLVAEHEVVGIGDFLRGWLRKLSAPSQTVKLLEQALEDERLLLLVDGLDEWSDPTAARAARVAILDFAGPRRLPVIASARPLGYERLGGLGADWRKAELLPFENEQQRRFTRAWFAHFYTATLPYGSSQDAVSSAAIRDTESFMAEVEQDRAISELAGTPLLLSALIFLRLQGGVLPRNRFDALDAITRALIHEQPVRRAEASLRGSNAVQQSPRVAERGIQFLALFIREQPGSESTPEDQARDALATFYQGREFRKPEAEAIELAATQVERATQEVGILVQRQPGQVGFLHRSLQEFLAAKEIVRRPFVDVKRYVVSRSSEPGWQDTLLAVLRLMGRQDEVDAILTEVREAPSGPLELPLRRSFLARAVFGDLNCSPSIANDLAEEIFSEIELSSWMPLREALLFEAVQGLDSEVLGRHVRNRLRKWFPGRQHYRFGLFRPLAEAPVAGTGRRLLVALFNADSGGEKKEIAEAIAIGAHAWPELGEKLATILMQPGDDDLLGAALDALAVGWPDHSRLSSLLLDASTSRADALRCVGLIHRVRRGDTSAEVKQSLAQFCHHGSRAYYSSMGDVLTTIAEGWPGDAELRRVALQSAQNLRIPAKWDHRLALRYLVKAFPGDNDVAEIIAGILQKEKHLDVAFDAMSDTWDAILAGFKSHPAIISAAEAWLRQHAKDSYDVVNIARIAMLARTHTCTQVLIEQLKTDRLFPQWIFHALFDIAGPDDPETREAVLSFISDENHISSVANYLPQVISDRDDCQKRLLQLLETARGVEVAHVLAGLDGIGRLDSPEAISLVDKRLRGDGDGQFWFHAKSHLWTRFPRHPLVRQGALQELETEHPLLSVVASAYATDDNFRPHLEEQMEPLHEDLRLTLARSLESLALREDPFARDLLALYAQEWDGEVRTAAAHAYYTAMKKRGQECESHLLRLRGELTDRGFPDETQHASVAGLLALRKMDSFLKQEGAHVPRLSTYSGSGRNWQFIRVVEEELEYLRETCGDAAWEIIGDWRVFVWHLARTGRQKLAMTVPARLVNEARHHAHEDVDAFWALAALEEGQETFREFCLGLYRRMCRSKTRSQISWGYKEVEVWIGAARYLATHYAGDAALGAELEEIAQHSHDRIGPVIALCRGWPQAGLIQKIWEHYSAHSLRSDAETAWIVNVKATRAQLVDYIHSLPAGLQNDSFWSFPGETLHAVRNRLVRDTEAQEMLFESIRNADSPDLVASLSRLLSTTVRDRQAIRDWAGHRIVELRKEGSIQAMGFDMLSGKVQPVEFSIMNACSGWSG
jgi:hypothetical protein